MNKKPFPTKTSLLNWFGDRGEVINKSWIKNWFVEDDYLYIQWTEKAPYHFQCDIGFDYFKICWKSLYYELDNEINLLEFLTNRIINANP